MAVMGDDAVNVARVGFKSGVDTSWTICFLVATGDTEAVDEIGMANFEEDGADDVNAIDIDEEEEEGEGEGEGVVDDEEVG